MDQSDSCVDSLAFPDEPLTVACWKPGCANTILFMTPAPGMWLSWNLYKRAVLIATLLFLTGRFFLGLMPKEALWRRAAIDPPRATFTNSFSSIPNRAAEHHQLAWAGAQRCSDERLRMPACINCIVGEVVGGCTASAAVRSLRSQIAALAAERFGEGAGLHLYPYLETPAFTSRHALFAHWMASEAPATVLEIGGYFEPLVRFLHGFCPRLIVTVDPVLEAESSFVPCGGGHAHVVFLPALAQELFSEEAALGVQHGPQGGRWDAIVCIGCDGHFGPRRANLLALPRPYTLYLEIPLAYKPSVEEYFPLTSVPGVTILLNATIDMREYPGPRTDYFQRGLYILRFA